MGYAKELADLDKMRVGGANRDDVAAAFPSQVLKSVGYFGPAEGAAAAFKKLAQGLDTAIVRVVSSKPGLESARAAMKACAPATIEAV